VIITQGGQRVAGFFPGFAVIWRNALGVAAPMFPALSPKRRGRRALLKHFINIPAVAAIFAISSAGFGHV
jgi:hypothetical protein